jgi:hypothetical protein
MEDDESRNSSCSAKALCRQKEVTIPESLLIVSMSQVYCERRYFEPEVLTQALNLSVLNHHAATSKSRDVVEFNWVRHYVYPVITGVVRERSCCMRCWSKA